MTYRNCFDHLGRPVARHVAATVGQRIVTRLAWLACLVFLALLAGLRL